MSEESTAMGPGRRRWCAVGHSDDPDPATAGAAAARAAITGEDAKLLIVFSSVDYDQEPLLAAINEVSGHVELVGCSTHGEITADGPRSGGVVVTALGGEGFAVASAASVQAVDDPRRAGEIVASCAVDIESRPHNALLLFPDSLISRQQEVVRGAYSVIGASMPIVGGGAAPRSTGEAAFQLHNASVLRESVVGVAIGSDAPIGIGLRHGWTRVGRPMVVTRAGKRSIQTLDDRPALEAYLAALDAPSDAATDPGAFREFALTHPLGLARRRGEDGARAVNGANFDDGSLRLAAPLPQGSLAWIMEGDSASVLGATEAACADALAPLDGTPPLAVLAFDCAARRGVLGEDGAPAEVERIHDAAGSAPVAGFYSWGEIARVHGQNGFHNQALVVMAVA